MPRYEGEINLLPNGEVNVVTRRKAETDNKYQTSYHEERSYRYPSIKEFRNFLVREKVYSTIIKVGTFIVEYGGVALAVTSSLPVLPVSPPELRTVIAAGAGVSLYFLGIGLSEAYKNSPRPRFDSQIKAFNQKFPSEPITLFKIPFLNRSS